MENAPTYIYQDLASPESLRLLRLLPDVKDAPLACELIETTREEAVYHALSYAWGEATFSAVIMERQIQAVIPITQNLLEALMVLRHTCEPLTLWIDAVCIDQANVSERNHQVQNMAATYANAVGIVVWLGKEAFSSELSYFKWVKSALSTDLRYGRLVSHPPRRVEVLADGAASRAPEEPRCTTYPYLNSSTRRRLAMRVRGPNLIVLDALQTFFRRAWFHRVWVVQEFVLARNVILLVNRDQLSLHVLGPAIQILGEIPISSDDDMLKWGLPWRPSHMRQDFEVLQNTVWMLNLMFSARAYPSTTKDQTLYQCCRMLMDQKCTDERDKVYAALGLAKADIGMTPDYTLSLRDILVDLTRRSLLALDFSVLHYAQTDRPFRLSANFPSYVSLLDGSKDASNIPEMLGGHDTIRYGAGLHLAPAIYLISDDAISLQGARIGQLVHILDVPRIFKSSTPQALMHSICMNGLKAYFRIIGRQRCVLDDLFAVREATVFSQSVNYSNTLQIDGISPFCKNRVLFITHSGHIGLAPAQSKIGDEVVVIYGAETPFVLRETTDEEHNTWKLVGECFVWGWMNPGQPFHGRIEGALEVEVKSHGTLEDPLGQKPTRALRQPVIQSEDFVLC